MSTQVTPGPCSSGGCPAPTEIDCVMVTKVYDFCFEQDVLQKRMRHHSAGMLCRDRRHLRRFGDLRLRQLHPVVGDRLRERHLRDRGHRQLSR